MALSYVETSLRRYYPYQVSELSRAGSLSRPPQTAWTAPLVCHYEIFCRQYRQYTPCQTFCQGISVKMNFLCRGLNNE